MPELPEVEWMVRNLARWAGAAPVDSVELHDPLLLAGGDPGALVGRALRPRRRGKYVVADAGEVSLVLHFRMTGKVVQADERPGRLTLRFAGGSAVRFVDPRRLGQAWCLAAAEVDRLLAGLGPEPWPEPRDGAWWAARFAAARGPIKPALLDQARVAGLGNIAGSEVCWRARIDPRKPTPALGAAEWTAIAAAVPAWIDAALDAEQGDEIRYVNQGGDSTFLVYGRAGQPCRRCAGTVERFVQAGRSTFWCGRCQARRGEG